MTKTTEGLALLREPFPASQISQLPKKSQSGQTVHLDYVGHAALTNRLLDADPHWNWEPMALNDAGLPAFDSTGGLWIRLTVCGVTRLGYGHAMEKRDPGAREKEVIGDALRNAAMRFGAALDLWHKGGPLHDEDGSPPPPKQSPHRDERATASAPVQLDLQTIIDGIGEARTMQDLLEWGSQAKGLNGEEKARARVAYAHRKAELEDAGDSQREFADQEWRDSAAERAAMKDG